MGKRQNKSGTEKKKRDKKPHPKALSLLGRHATAEDVGRGEGTAHVLGRIAHTPAIHAAHEFRGPVKFVFNNCWSRDPMHASEGAQIEINGGMVAGAIHAHRGSTVTLTGDVLVDQHTELTADVDATIKIDQAVLGDRLERDLEITTRAADGIISTQLVTPFGAIVSAAGALPDLRFIHQSVGVAMKRVRGDGYEIELETHDGIGVSIRGRRCDPEVDVCLVHQDEDGEKLDVPLQVFMIPGASRQLGDHDLAVDVVIDANAIHAALAHKGPRTLDRLELVLRSPVPIHERVQKALEAAAGRGEIRRDDYARVWLVDPAGVVIKLCEHPSAPPLGLAAGGTIE